MVDYGYLLSDPRPEESDSKRWRCALLMVHRVVPDRDKSIDLGSRLWTMRAMGATLKPDRVGLRFCYLPGGWTDEKEFESFKANALGVYREEVIRLLNQVEIIVDKHDLPEEWRQLA